MRAAESRPANHQHHGSADPAQTIRQRLCRAILHAHDRREAYTSYAVVSVNRSALIYTWNFHSGKLGRSDYRLKSIHRLELETSHPSPSTSLPSTTRTSAFLGVASWPCVIVRATGIHRHQLPQAAGSANAIRYLSRLRIFCNKKGKLSNTSFAYCPRPCSKQALAVVMPTRSAS